jgi:hypothetical protein
VASENQPQRPMYKYSGKQTRRGAPRDRPSSPTTSPTEAPADASA